MTASGASGPNNGQPKTGCGLAVAQGAISVALDLFGAIPGLGNVASTTAARCEAFATVRWGGAAYGWGRDLGDHCHYLGSLRPHCFQGSMALRKCADAFLYAACWNRRFPNHPGSC